MSFLSVSGIHKATKNGFELRDISFELSPFRRLALAGETGSGKSTLLKIIAGLVQPEKGELFFEGKRVKGPDEQLLPGHHDIAYLSQHYELRNHYRVEELLDMANKLTDVAAHSIYEICRIGHLLKRKTDELSGGERQRIALAKLLTAMPKLLLLDEPFSNLDPIHKSILKAVIEDICDQLKITCILASHDPVDTLSWADEIIVLKGGEILQRGIPASLYHKPVNEYMAALFGAYNVDTRERIFALFSIVINKPAGKELLLRPENFRVSPSEFEGSISGKVTRNSFFGMYAMIDVLVGETTVTAITTDKMIKTGSNVFIALLPDSIWFIDATEPFNK